jgi:hypothetical protein
VAAVWDEERAVLRAMPVPFDGFAERIVVVCAGEVIGEHPRFFDRGRTLYNPWHYVAALERKPGRTAQRRSLQGLEPPGLHDTGAGTTGQAHRRRSAVCRHPVDGLFVWAGSRQ